MPTKDNILRMDFKIKNPKLDKKTGKFSFVIIPDPERYELKKLNGKTLYYDKYDKICFDLETVAKAAKKATTMPMHFSPPKENDYKILVASRIDEIKSYISMNKLNYSFVDKSEDFLKKIAEEDQRKYIILSIDLMGSTKMSQELNQEDNLNIIRIFSREMAALTENFNGFILKYLGDGVICYFPEPNFSGMNDNAINCAHFMKHFIIKILNPILEKNNLPKIKFRIGLDSGEATSVIIGHENTKQHMDLIGPTINIATKIQSLATENSVFIGESTALNVHILWRKMLEDVSLPKEWPYKDKSRNPYKVFELKDK